MTSRPSRADPAHQGGAGDRENQKRPDRDALSIWAHVGQRDSDAQDTDDEDRQHDADDRALAAKDVHATQGNRSNDAAPETLTAIGTAAADDSCQKHSG